MSRAPRPTPGRETVAGRHSVVQALQSDRDIFGVLAARSADPATIRMVQEAAARRGVTVRFVGDQEMVGLAGTARHQGVAAIVGPLPAAGVLDLVQAAKAAGQEPLLVAVDGVEDAQNLGAIARSALLAGCHGLIVPERGTASLGVGAHKAASGALTRLPVANVANLRTALEQLRREGVWVVGADAQTGKAPWNLPLRGPVCFVLGSEQDGLSNQAQEALDATVSIPTPGGDLSLNVSVAAAVLLFETVRQRSSAGRA